MTESSGARRARIGIIGCGNISGIYLDAPKRFSNLEVVAVADLDADRARAQAEKYGVPQVLGVEEIVRADVDAIVNLTVPAAHASVSLAAVQAGRNVYTEKPLAVSLEDGRALMAAADALGVRVGCAPDTVLGAGIQTCRKLIDDGVIGEPVAATAFMMSRGVEAWHPNPFFFYQPGAGPMFDMGPYYLTAMVTLLGPIATVSGAARASFAERVSALTGERIPVNTPTHVAGLLEFGAGPIGTIITSFDVWGSNLPRIEIYGSEGSLSVPDPNTFGGPVRLRRAGEKEWQDVPLTHPFEQNSRGLGLSEMMRAIEAGRPHRASGELGLHVLETMHAVLESAREGRRVTLASRPARPEALPAGEDERVLI